MKTQRKNGWLIEVVDRNGEGVCWVSRPGDMIAGYGRVSDRNPKVAVLAAIAKASLEADAGHPWDGRTAASIYDELFAAPAE